jgi:hypothetical protein
MLLKTSNLQKANHSLQFMLVDKKSDKQLYWSCFFIKKI